jgi:hypothetical protein
VRGTCSQHAGAAVAPDPRVLRGSPHSFERKRVPPLFLLSAPMVGGRDWSSGGRARDAPAARARRREDAARAAALTERAALTSFDRPPIVIKRTFPRGVSPWDVSRLAQCGCHKRLRGRERERIVSRPPHPGDRAATILYSGSTALYAVAAARRYRLAGTIVISFIPDPTELFTTEHPTVLPRTK